MTRHTSHPEASASGPTAAFAAKKEYTVVGTIIVTIIVGAIIGALGRLLVPGKQNISLVVTILIGIVANLIVGVLLGALFGYNNGNGGIAWIGVIIGAVVAALLIVLYGRMRPSSV